MREKVIAAAASIAILCMTLRADVLVDYHIDATDSAAPDVAAANLTAGDLTWTTGGIVTFGTSDWGKDWDDHVRWKKYGTAASVSFTITPDSGYTANYTNLSFDVQMDSDPGTKESKLEVTTSATGGSVLYSLYNAAAWTAAGSNPADAYIDSNWAVTNVDLSGFSALQNVTGAVTVSVSFVDVSTTPASRNLRLDNVTLEGVTDIDPNALAVASAGAVLDETDWYTAGYGSVGYAFFKDGDSPSTALLSGSFDGSTGTLAIARNSVYTHAAAGEALELPGGGTFQTGAWLSYPLNDDVLGDIATITFKTGSPTSARVGILVGTKVIATDAPDPADFPQKVALNGIEQVVTKPASGTRADWYFFDVTNIGEDDTLTISASRISGDSGHKNNPINGIVISDIPGPQLTYGATTFPEKVANDGSVDGTTITLSGGLYNGTSGEDFVATSKVTPSNLPSGLTVSMTMNAASNALALTFGGKADDHEFEDNVTNLTFTFNNDAFANVAANQIDNYAKDDLSIAFDNQPSPVALVSANSAASSGDAAAAFDGASGTRWDSAQTDNHWVYIDLGDDYFLNAVTIDWETAASQNYTLRGRTQAQGLDDPVDPANWTEIASVTGRSGVNGAGNGADESFGFTYGNFTALNGAASDSSVNTTPQVRYLMMYGTTRATVYGHSIYELTVDGVTATPALSYSSTAFVEKSVNDGGIVNSITVDLINGTFASVSPFVVDTHFTAAGVPSGLAVSITTNSATQLTIELTDEAVTHTAAASTNISLAFTDAAFATAAASEVTASSNDLSVTFFDSLELVYSPATYLESTENDGAVGGGTISLSGDLFDSAEGDDLVAEGHVSVDNLPAGLAVSMILSADANELTVAFAGRAIAHEAADTVADLSFTFSDEAFLNLSASQIAGSSRGDLSIVFSSQPDPIAYWNFDEGSGTVAADTSDSATQHSGTLGGDPQWVTGRMGTALEFDGAGDYVTVPHHTEMGFGPADAFTVMVWAKPTGANAGWRGIVSKSRGSSPYWEMRFDNGTWRFNGEAGATGSHDKWQHVTIVQDPSDGTEKRKVYINGSRMGAVNSLIGQSGTGNLYIGAADPTFDYFEGIIDEVKIFDSALSETELNTAAGFAGGSIEVELQEMPTAVNLSVFGRIDWHYWQASSPTSPTQQKSGGTAIDAAASISAHQGQTSLTTLYEWSDGSPAAIGSTNSVANMRAGGPGRASFTVELGADVTYQLRAWVGCLALSADRTMTVTATYSNGDMDSQELIVPVGERYEREALVTLTPEGDTTVTVEITSSGESSLTFGMVALRERPPKASIFLFR